MDNIPYRKPPRWWEPRPSELFMWLASPYRKLRRRFWERLAGVDVHGLEHVRQSLDRGCGILIVSNHAAHSDPLVFMYASDQLDRYFYYIANWQSFHMLPRIGQRVLQWHGCFSIDREGVDEPAYNQAVRVIRTGTHPLMVFAEGHVHHHYQRVAPFRTGASLFAQAAAQNTQRAVVCIPAAVTYQYTRRPLPALTRLLARLEQKLGQRTADGTFAERVRRVGERVLEHRETQYGGQPLAGPYCDRAVSVLTAILERLEALHGLAPRRLDVPGRVTQLRRLAIQQLVSQSSDRTAIEGAERQLHDLQVVTQLYSCRHDFDTEETTFEHLAEVLDKFEEDILGARTAGTRGRRRAYLRFGPPVPVRPSESPRKLTTVLHERVQTLVNGLISDCGPREMFRWSGV